ncbi:hypothetical protein Dimus_004750 [Dionaea muscipula]
MESRGNFPSHEQPCLLPDQNRYTKPMEEFFTLENINPLSSSSSSSRSGSGFYNQEFHQLDQLNINGYSSSNSNLFFFENNGSSSSSCFDPLLDPAAVGLGCLPSFDFYEMKPLISNGGVNILPPNLIETNNFPVIGGGISHHSPIINANSMSMVTPLRSRLMFPNFSYREMETPAAAASAPPPPPPPPLKYRPPDEGSSCTTAENAGHQLPEGGSSSVLATAPPKRTGKGKKKKKYNVVKGQWTIDEDRLLVQLVERYGVRKWSQIAQLLNGRIGKQCRERWHNHLRPDIKKDVWSEEEDKILIEAHAEIGNKWAEIAKRLPGRTENSIKNHWNATKRRQFSRRKCRSKYPRQSSLLQEYIKGLNIEKINAGCRKKTSQLLQAAGGGGVGNMNNNATMAEATTTSVVQIYDAAPPPPQPQQPQPQPDQVSAYPASEASSGDRLVPEYDFSEVPEFNFDANMFEESSIESLMDEINYGRQYDPFGDNYNNLEMEIMPQFDATSSLMMNFEVKKELDLVEMINQVTL